MYVDVGKRLAYLSIRRVKLIFQPKIGQEAVINYKDKFMPLQGIECVIYGVSKGPGPRNVMVLTTEFTYPHYCQWFIVPRGNLNAA